MSDVKHKGEISLYEWTCKDCKSPLMATRSGSACPNGCGKLYPKMPTAVKRINHAVILGVQRIENRMGRYYLDNGEEVEVAKQLNREIKQHELKTVALNGTTLCQIKPKQHDTEHQCGVSVVSTPGNH